jgi:hypothetical protein
LKPEEVAVTQDTVWMDFPIYCGGCCLAFPVVRSSLLENVLYNDFQYAAFMIIHFSIIAAASCGPKYSRPISGLLLLPQKDTGTTCR